MTGESLTVLVIASGHGREVIPTLRSLRAARGEFADRGNVTIRVVGGTSVIKVVQEWSHEIGCDDLVFSEASARDDLLHLGLGDVSSALVGVVRGGDLVGETWLREAARIASERECVVQPAVVVTFGRRSGIWRQSDDLDSRTLRRSARFDLRAPFAVMPTDAIRRTLVVDHAGPWALRVDGLGVPVVTAPDTTAFLRVWKERAPWEPRLPVLTASLLLRSSVLMHAPRLTALRRGRARRGRVASAVRGLVRPWGDLVRRIGPAQQPKHRFTEAMLRQWRVQNAIEPLIPFPRTDVAYWYEDADATVSAEADREIDAYWSIASRAPEGLDYVFFAPWLRTGGGDTVLLQYVESVRRLDPTARVAIITTEPVESTNLDRVGASVEFIELRPFLDAGVSRDAFVEWIVPQLIAQWRVHTVHAFNSTVAFDVVERWGVALARRATLFLSTFAFDRDAEGERTSVLFLRPPAFLDPIRAVLVDSQFFVATAVGELGYPRGRFMVMPTPVPAISRTSSPRAGRRLRLLWVGRFDIPKRLDILAAIAREVAARRLPVEIHFYGAAVMGDPELQSHLAALAQAGSIPHPPYQAFGDLPLDTFDAYVMTSEWEGVPLSLLEAMSAGLPAIAPLVGGIGEVLDETTGYPVDRFDDVEAYVARILEILADPTDAEVRGTVARDRVRAAWSVSRFDADLRGLAGYLRPSLDRSGKPV